MKALRLYAGPQALAHIRSHGLQPQDIAAIPGAAGGPKGLILGPLDRFLFGQWLTQSTQPIDLVGASIGAWRLATACLNDCESGFRRLEHDYIAQHYELEPGRKRPTAAQVSREFGRSLEGFYGGRIEEVLGHPRWRLHVMTSRGIGMLARLLGLTVLFFVGWRRPLRSREALGFWYDGTREGKPVDLG